MSLVRSVAYLAESAMYYPDFVRQVKAEDIGPDARLLAEGKHTANVGCAIYSAVLFDMARGVLPKESQHDLRERVKFLGGLSMWFFDLADSAVDDPFSRLSPAQKKQGLTVLADRILGKDSETILPDSIDLRSAYQVGGILEGLIGRHSEALTYRDAIKEALELENAHERLRTPDELIKYAVLLGETCGKLMAGPVEFVLNQSLPEVINAAKHIGVYGQILDHVYEVDEDLASDANTFMTAAIHQQPDEPRARAHMKEKALDLAADYRRNGREGLPKTHKRKYEGLVNLFDFRYKVMIRARNHKKRLPAQELNLAADSV